MTSRYKHRMLWQSSQIEKKLIFLLNNAMLIKRDRFQRKIHITYTINLPLFCDPIKHDRTITKNILEHKKDFYSLQLGVFLSTTTTTTG